MTAADERDPAAGAWPADRIRRYVWLGAGVLIAAAVAYLAWRVAAALAAVLVPVAIAVLLTALPHPAAVTWALRCAVVSTPSGTGWCTARRS